jgi:hypothetical protein
MSGLSSGYILSKMAGAGTTAKTKQLILNFLNSAPSASALAGIEPQEGPIFDDPTQGYGNQIRDYDIGTIAANRIIAKRNSLGMFTDLTQLSGISYFGTDKFNDLLYSFATRVTEISSIRFNCNDGTITNDALNIRKNFSTALTEPSWRNGISTTYKDSPALYAIKESKGNPILIKSKFKSNGLSAAYIRAIGGGRLGDVKEKCILFDSNGDSAEESFELQNTTFHNYGVGAYNIDWKWQWKLKQTDTWKDIGYTHHRVFIILQTPTLPWVQTIGNTSLPWTDALEIACLWASGAKTQIEAASLITDRYNGCGKVSYDTASGATMYGSATYNLTKMIERINGGAGLGGKVNCTDSADTVTTLANLLGCELWESRMGWGFRCNEIIAIGYAAWAVPFGWGFNYHEVPWTGNCTVNDYVYDGCLKVDGDADPTTAPHSELLPKNMLFGDCTALNYRKRLSPPTADGCVNCNPLVTRQRRAII